MSGNTGCVDVGILSRQVAGMGVLQEGRECQEAVRGSEMSSSSSPLTKGWDVFPSALYDTYQNTGGLA